MNTEDFRRQVDEDMQTWATDVMARRKAISDAIPPPKPFVVTSEAVVHPETPFRHFGDRDDEQLPNGGSQDDDPPFTPPITEPCPCPDGLSETYCVPGLVITGPTVLTRIDDCHWCGYTEESEDDRTKWQLYIGDDPYPPFDRGCGWILDAHDGDFIFFKEWDGGNPLGTYYNEDETSFNDVAECDGGASPLFPCF